MARGQAQALLRAARRDTSSVGAIYRWQRRIFRTMAVAMGLYALAILCTAVFELLSRWQGGFANPDIVIGFSVVMLLLTPVVAAICVSGASNSRKLGVSFWALRRAGAVNDNELLPSLTLQSKSIEPDDTQSTPHYFAHIRWLDDLAPVRLMGAVRLALSAYFPLLAAAFWLMIPQQSSTGLLFLSPYYLPVFLSTMIFFLVVIFGMLSTLVVTGAQRRRGVTVVADAEGLRWWRRRFAHAEHHIAWGELRSFAQVNFLPTSSYAGQKPSKMFLLDTGAAILAWGYEPMHMAYGESMTNETTDLVRLIVTHTNLPLRDATPLAAEIAEKAGGVNGRFWRRMLAPQRGARPAATIAGLDDVLRPPRRERLRAWSLVGLAFAPLVAYLVVVGVFMATHP